MPPARALSRVPCSRAASASSARSAAPPTSATGRAGCMANAASRHRNGEHPRPGLSLSQLRSASLRRPVAATPAVRFMTPATTTPPPASKTILVVEDHDMLREVLERVLQRSGFKVLGAEHG